MTPIAVTIAGSDPSGGAGIQADLKTFSALHVYGASVITSLTAQNTRGVFAVHDVPADFVEAQMDAVFSDLVVDAVKIGMISQPDIVEIVADCLDRYDQQRIVVDPVMVATSGDRLISEDAIAAIRDILIPRAMIITPNLAEAAELLGTAIASSDEEMADQAVMLFEYGPKAVLIKGGHGDGTESSDIFYDGSDIVRVAAPRIETFNTHGTGCTLSSAIAASLAQEFTLPRAVAQAKNYVTEAIRHADELSIGAGAGPVHHFHAIWDYVPVFGQPPRKSFSEDVEDVAED
ncbi:MAG: bifunctional hydroxymethylpyrimidine kinase/phosphomethylpyrimidine kinase [Fimbriimonadaceae bacterium]|nr:bifunctional hydroxymethylpyrimidine kinase/phosphomethylpyrimidine kinase [Alphaproteobacteria bacterium]